MLLLISHVVAILLYIIHMELSYTNTLISFALEYIYMTFRMHCCHFIMQHESQIFPHERVDFCMPSTSHIMTNTQMCLLDNDVYE